jgi:hypothetical protein
MALDTVLHKVMNAVLAKLQTLTDGPSNPAIFGATRVFVQGEVVNYTTMPIAIVAYGEERSEHQDQPLTKIGCWMPWTVEVQFDDAAPGSTLRQKHTHMYGRVLDAFMNDRALGGVGGGGGDTRYLGGGSKLQAANTENEPDRWTFTLNLETYYRHKDTDSSIAA